MKIKTVLLACSLGSLMMAGAAAAQAPVAQDTYSFSYTLDSGTTDTGVLTGTLQSDGNTFDITGVKSFSVGGEAYLAPLTVESTDQFVFGYKGSPVADLNKSFIDFTIGSKNNGDFLAFGVGDQTAAYFQANVDAASSNFGGDDGPEYFDGARYAASAMHAGGGGGGGPEPSTWALMMVGVFGVGAALRRGKGQPGFASAGLSPT